MGKNKIIIVDENDNQIGLADKIEAHTTKPQLHRAITCFLKNEKGEYLITKRAKTKLLWPEIWETTCSTHPNENESYEACTERRLKEELDIDTKVKLKDKFVYRAPYKNIGSENEVCALLVGGISGPVNPNKNEIADYKFVNLEELQEDIKNHPKLYAPWLETALKKLG